VQIETAQAEEPVRLKLEIRQTGADELVVVLIEYESIQERRGSLKKSSFIKQLKRKNDF
jgi:hypothetical protein